MEPQHEPVILDGPMEIECDHGHHSVIDPEAFVSLISQRKFRCAHCGERKKVQPELVSAIVQPNGQMRGVCAACEVRVRDEAIDDS